MQSNGASLRLTWEGKKQFPSTLVTWVPLHSVSLLGSYFLKEKKSWTCSREVLPICQTFWSGSLWDDEWSKLHCQWFIKLSFSFFKMGHNLDPKTREPNFKDQSSFHMDAEYLRNFFCSPLLVYVNERKGFFFKRLRSNMDMWWIKLKPLDFSKWALPSNLYTLTFLHWSFWSLKSKREWWAFFFWLVRKKIDPIPNVFSKIPMYSHTTYEATLLYIRFEGSTNCPNQFHDEVLA